VREWLAELGPGLDVQVGVDSVSEVESHDMGWVSPYSSCFEAKGEPEPRCTILLGRWRNSRR
jgi:hypothetical protein